MDLFDTVRAAQIKEKRDTKRKLVSPAGGEEGSGGLRKKRKRIREKEKEKGGLLRFSVREGNKRRQNASFDEKGRKIAVR